VFFPNREKKNKTNLWLKQNKTALEAGYWMLDASHWENLEIARPDEPVGRGY